ncbi:MAG: hypothetical protein KC940_24670, partial [Candidatus Omnitrophica bacterium]|nr:hypothetical protein [Candidatus Omnitrophota bacterium]
MKRLLIGVGCLALSLVLAGAASALSYDQNVTNNAIFGGGNANGSYTVDRSNGVELGIRGKLRHNASGAPENTFNSNGDGTYSFNAGVGPTQSFPTAEWSFEWSINTDYLGTSGVKLDDLTYQLCLDTEVSQAVNYSIVFDPINGINPGNSMVFWDHSIGDNSTGSGAGDEAINAGDYATLISSYNLAQQSWKPHWYMPGFDPTVDATYNIKLSASNSLGVVAQTEIQIIVGAGG